MKMSENTTINQVSENSEIIETELISLDDVLKKNENKSECVLSLYETPPNVSLDLQQLYEVTNQRYRVLQLLADIGDCDMTSKEKWIPAFFHKLNNDEFREFYVMIISDFNNSTDLDYLHSYDAISHYLLRTACARLYESLKWFIKQEIKLFHIRWNLLNNKQRQYFINKSRLVLNTVSVDERIILFDEYRDFNLLNDLYKTQFYNASKLVRLKKTYLLNGWIYYKLDDAVYPILHMYEEYLNRSLRQAKRKNDMRNSFFDTRYSFFFTRISEEIRLSLFKFNPEEGGRIKISDLEQFSKQHYPLCMNILHYSLLQNCHLRHNGRFQYNLFLKGIGLSLHDSITFWRCIFLKKMTLENFVQKYLYNIRHNYGKLGKLADYPPLSCQRILESTPGPLDHHGCPFKNPNIETLVKHLQRNDLSDDQIEQILQKVNENVPQQACAKMFEIKHNVVDQGATVHPNLYFTKSKELREKRLLQEKNCTNCSVNRDSKEKQSTKVPDNETPVLSTVRIKLECSRELSETTDTNILSRDTCNGKKCHNAKLEW